MTINLKKIFLLSLSTLIFALGTAPVANAVGGPIEPQVRRVNGSKAWKYSPDFLHALSKKQIKSVELSSDKHQIKAQLLDKSKRTISYPPSAEESIVNALAKQNVPISVSGSGGISWGNIFFMLFLFVGFMMLIQFFLGRKQQKGQGDSGIFKDRNQKPEIKKGLLGKKKKSKKKSADEPTNLLSGAPLKPITPVAGCDEALEEINEFKEFLVKHYKFRRLGAKMPKGVLLYGPPGTGKTLMVKNLAQGCGVAFIPTAGSEFVERYVGVGAERVRELFKKARSAPNGAIIFIDEIDAIGRSRSSNSVNEERENTLNQLLVEMDGFDSTDKIIVMAATNRLDVLDPALVRAGRFSRKIHVGLPSAKGRAEILGVHTKSKPLAADVDLAKLAETTFGASGATLAETVNEAAIMAARENCTEIHHKHFVEGHLRVMAGPEKKNPIWGPGEKETIAWHEAGHVVSAEVFRGHEKAQRATIRPRGEAGGMAIYGQSDKALLSSEDVYGKLVVLLGGRAAEEIHNGITSSGASNDLQRASSIARQAIEEWGFSPGGVLFSPSAPGERSAISDKSKERIDEEVDKMVTDAYDRVLTILLENKDALERVANLLLHKEDVIREEIVQAIGTVEEVSWNSDHISVSSPVQTPLPEQATEIFVPEVQTVVAQPLEKGWTAKMRRAKQHSKGYAQAIKNQYKLHRKKQQDADSY